MTVVEQNDLLRIERIETPSYGNNAYIIVCQATEESVLVDAPGDVDTLLERLKKTNPLCILMTHAHGDHTDVLRQLKEELGIPLAAHPADAAEYLPLIAEMLLAHGNIIAFGKVTLEVIHTPGHTPGSLCFLTGNYLLSGDTIISGGPGKTGSPEDFQKIIDSLKQNVFVLPDDVKIYPGHGNSTVLKKEKEEFAVFSAKLHEPGLCGDVLWLKD